MRKTLFSLILLAFAGGAAAQEVPKWDLRRCVEYAMANNVSVKQADIQARSSEIIAKQAKYQQYGQLNYNLNHGFSYGRSLNQATNVLQDANLMYENMGLQGQVTLFNWGSLRNNTASAKYANEADKAAVDKARNDIGLNVANQYLRALLSLEQSKVNETQLNQTRAQFQNTRKQVDAGSLPELNAAELEAQVARDSATLIASQVQYQVDLLTLKGLLNLPADAPFDIEAPPVEKIPIDNILEQNPANVYAMAMNTQPQIKGNQSRLMAAEKGYESARGRLYPTFTAFGNLQTRFNQNFTTFNQTGIQEITTGTYIKSGTGNVPVYAQTPVITTGALGLGNAFNGYWNQLNNNFGQSIGIALNVPIFNGWQARANVAQSKLDIERAKLTITRDTLQLKQDIYNAYQQAIGAYNTYIAREKAVRTSERSFELSTKRYEAGVQQTIEWLQNQNNLTRARIDKLIAQYNYVFAMKVLEFYKGQGLRL
ncbi:MAG: TolC family protein [Chitinophagaceae bacterium]